MPVETYFCTDEQLLVRAPSDCGLLRPQSSRLATGTDGAFASGNRWKLTSSSNAFQSQGVEEGHLVLLSDEDTPLTYGSGGEPFVVETVASDGITLRRAGWDAGVGLPPGASGGSTGVTFLVTSFAPQIESASYRINQLFGVDEEFEARASANLYDAREIQELCVLLVLHRLYMDVWAKSRDDLWKAKAEAIDAEMKALLPTLTVRWGTDGKDGPPSSRRSARVSR